MSYLREIAFGLIYFDVTGLGICYGVEFSEILSVHKKKRTYLNYSTSCDTGIFLLKTCYVCYI